MKVFFSFFLWNGVKNWQKKKFCFRIYYYLWRQERQQSRYLKTLLWLKWWKGVTYFTLQCFVLGSTIALRGDVIRCTVVFEKEQETDGKIQDPVVFSVNGSRIVSEDKHPSFIEYNEDRPLFPYVSFENENSVLAKVLNILTFFNTFYSFNPWKYKTISVTSPSSGEWGRWRFL